MYKKDNRYYDGYDMYPQKEKEYYVPKPPEQDEHPQWIHTGSAYPSDATGDGPDLNDNCTD